MLAAIPAAAQENDCVAQMHRGEFRYKDAGDDVVIKRTKTKQIEIFNGGKSKYILKLDWISETEYTLTYIKAVGTEESESHNEIRCRIIRCEGNESLVEYMTNEGQFGQTTIVKVD